MGSEGSRPLNSPSFPKPALLPSPHLTPGSESWLHLSAGLEAVVLRQEVVHMLCRLAVRKRQAELGAGVEVVPGLQIERGRYMAVRMVPTVQG